MLQVSLAEYRRRIAEQIENGHIDEAIAHSRHVLAHHPRYLSVYKLLAHACLEKGDFSHANHFFQCVLSADLEDADAWINLALLAKDLGETQQAIWFLERAFEVAPGNTRVREMLRQLYVQRDGAERTRIKLTPTALARLYAKGGFYERAIRELDRMLQESANLPRLQVATLEASLAQALWNTEDGTLLADQVCHSLLDKVPDSLQANLLLGEMRASAGRHQESEPYLQVARMLDPEGELAQELLGHRSPLPLQEVKIPYLEYQAPQIEEAQAVAAEAEDTSWLDRIGVSVEPLDLETEQKPPAWIKNWTENEALMPTAFDQEPLGVDRSETRPESGPQSVELPQDTTEVPDWLLEVQRESAAPDTDKEIPDWLRDSADKAEGESDLTGAEQLPDWIEELDAKEPVETAPQTEEQPTLQGDLPDWLLELSQAEDLGTEAVRSASEEEPTDWPKEQETAHPPGEVQPEKATKPLRAPTSQEDAFQSEQMEDLPQWFDELRQEAETAASAEPEKETALMPAAEPPGPDAVPDWLRQMSDKSERETPDTPTAEAAEPTAPLAAAAAAGLVSLAANQEEPLSETAAEDLPTWLQELEAEISGVKKPAPLTQDLSPIKSTEAAPVTPPETVEPVVPAMEAMPEKEQPDRLFELDKAAAPKEIPDAALEPAPEDETPNWLRELDRADQVAPSALPAVKEPEFEPEVELEGIPEAALEATPDDDLPDWLQGLRTESELAETWTPTEQEADEFAPAKESALEPTPDEELPDWLQQLRPAGELQPDRAVSLAKETEPIFPAAPAEPIDETVPAPSDEMEDMEWLRELEETAIAEAPQAEPEPAESILAITRPLPKTERAREEPAIARVEPQALDTAEAPPEPAAVEPQVVDTAEALLEPAAVEPQVLDTAEVLPEPAAVEPPPVEKAPAPRAQDPETRIALARTRLLENALDDSAQEYERLVLEPDLARELVEELEKAIQTHPEHPALQRVLGDAYMRTGKLQKALGAYRKALSKL